MKNIESIVANTLRGISPLILSVILIGFFLTGCSSQKNKEDALALPTLEPTPRYLLNLVPTGVISQQDYEESRTTNFWIFRGIAVGIFTTRMGVSENNEEWEIIKDRAKLFIDGEQVSNDSFVGGADGVKGGGLFRLSWAPTLTPGTHEAKFQFITDGGDKLEYSWQFIIEK